MSYGATVVSMVDNGPCDNGIRYVKPVFNDHLYNKIHYLWFIQLYVLMKIECTNTLLLRAT